MKKIIVIIFILTLFQSCYFGMFLVEQNLPGNYSLWAENSYDQLKITHSKKNTSVYNIVVGETVYAIGYNNDFIIAKSFSKKDSVIRYHIVNIKEDSSNKNIGTSFEQYNLMRVKLNIPYDLNFDLVFHEVAKN